MSQDFLPLNGTDHIEFWVGNAKQAAFYYQHAFGFELVAYAGPETGVRDRASYVLQQGKVRFVLTTAMHQDHEITRHVAQHVDGVKVPRARRTRSRAPTPRGADGGAGPSWPRRRCARGRSTSRSRRRRSLAP